MLSYKKKKIESTHIPPLEGVIEIKKKNINLQMKNFLYFFFFPSNKISRLTLSRPFSIPLSPHSLSLSTP
jgi:hypothetical protein